MFLIVQLSRIISAETQNDLTLFILNLGDIFIDNYGWLEIQRNFIYHNFISLQG